MKLGVPRGHQADLAGGPDVPPSFRTAVHIVLPPTSSPNPSGLPAPDSSVSVRLGSAGPAALSVWALRGVFLKPRGVPGARPRSAESKPTGGGSRPLRRLATRATPTPGQRREPPPQDAADCAAEGQARLPGFRLSREVS